MFKIKFLPATIGDSIWVSYGDPGDFHHILIDGGTRGTRRFIEDELARAEGEVELMVVSHIDKDHIGGILALLQRREVEMQVGDFWFNAFRHLPVLDDDDDGLLSVLQGEQLSSELEGQEISWNGAFGGDAVMIPDTGDLPEIILPGGMKLTLLSPTGGALSELRGIWEEEIAGAGVGLGMEMPEDGHEEESDDDDDFLGAGGLPDVGALAEEAFTDDTSEANGSSIAFLADYEGKRVLFAADAHVGKLLDALERVSPGERLALDLFKISHHGSRSTTSRELIAKVDCPRFVFSTNGSIFKHPHHEAVSRVIVEGGEAPELIFNYKGARNEIWGNGVMQGQHGYTATYPASDNGGVEVEL